MHPPQPPPTVQHWTFLETNLLSRSVLHRFPLNLFESVDSPVNLYVCHSSIAGLVRVRRIQSLQWRRVWVLAWAICMRACPQHPLACIQSATVLPHKNTASLSSCLSCLTYDRFYRSSKMWSLALAWREGRRKWGKRWADKGSSRERGDSIKGINIRGYQRLRRPMGVLEKRSEEKKSEGCLNSWP